MAVGDGRVVSNFIVQALQGDDLTIYGDGKQTRSFCYVDDLVSGIVKVLELPNVEHSPINLGNPGEFTMLELANLVIKQTKSESKVIFEKLPLDDPRQRKPDITRAKVLLDWKPQVDLNSGVARTVEYFEGVLHQ
jgi:UDP-glucuronate decarboxylase